MSGLARIAQAAGAACSGSDINDTTLVRGLVRDGIPVTLEQTRDAVPRGCDLVVTSAAIPPEHPEAAEARERGIEVVKYARMLGRLMASRTGVAVAGTHGKSTATAMLTHALITAGLDPSFVMGANCPQIGGGSRHGRGDLFVVEACEFDRSFLNLHPTRAIFLNIEADHLDVYGSLDNIVAAFAELAGRLPAVMDERGGGYLLVDHNAPGREQWTRGLACRVETIGFSPAADWRVTLHDGAHPRVELAHHGRVVCRWSPPLPGRHMAYNAAAAAVMAHRSGATWRDVAHAMGTFRGLDRRVQLVGTRDTPQGPVTVVDDYGHHPTEIRATLAALRRRYRPKRVICVFQPHQHSRTRSLLDDFAASFADADRVIVPEIYSARDNDDQRRAIGSIDLVNRITQHHTDAHFLATFDAVLDHLQAHTQPHDLVITMGAGDVWKIAQRFTSPQPAT